MDGPGRRADCDDSKGELVMSFRTGADYPPFVAPLFVPANRSDRFRKAAASGADALILDLEDAVPPEAKHAARAALIAGFTDLPIFVRINAAGTEWHEQDLAAVAGLSVAGIMVPKAESVSVLEKASRIAPVIALIETAVGVGTARALATSGAAQQFAFGSVDFAVEMGCAHEPGPLSAARSEILLASRLGGLRPPIDGVTTAIDDLVMVKRDAAAACAFGFGAKLLIHPKQVPPVFEAFTPSANQIAWAKRVLSSGDGSARVDGEMVDAPVRERARALLSRATRHADLVAG